MKKVIIFSIFLLILTILVGCQSNDVEDLSFQIEALEKENSLLRTELEKLIKERDKLISEKKDSEENLTNIDEKDILIEVVDKINKPKDVDNWILDDRVNFYIRITNNYKKDIKEIQGILDIKNTSGVSIFRASCDLEGQIIKAGQSSVNKATIIKINEYINEDIRLYNADHSDLDYTYTIEQIIFTDGTSEG